MLNVTDEVKRAFQTDSTKKYMRINIGGTNYTNKDIYFEEFELKESIMDSKIEFVGCISNEMKVKLYIGENSRSSVNYRGLKASAFVKIVTGYDEDENEIVSDEIQLFSGLVDSAKKDSNMGYINLTCYDDLYYKGQANVYNWYKNLFKIKKRTIKEFRESLCDYLGILGDDEISLPQDDVIIKKRLKDKSLTAIQLLEDLCQINACCGLIGRDGNIKFIFPGATENPIEDDEDDAVDIIVSPSELIKYYRSATYSDFYIAPFSNGITLRTNAQDKGITLTAEDAEDVDWDDDTEDTYFIEDTDEDVTNGSYIIQGNIYAIKLSKKKRKALVSQMFKSIQKSLSFKTYEIVCNGLPYVECGDTIEIINRHGDKLSFVVTNRSLKGIQSMTDTFSMQISAESEMLADGGAPQIVGTSLTPSYVSEGNYSYDSVSQIADSASYEAEQVNEFYLKVVNWDAETGVLTTTSDWSPYV